MMHNRLVLMGVLSFAIVLTACSRNSDPNLLNLKSNKDGPDEFAVLPSKPLTLPDDFSTLPEPTPGGGNLTDVTPVADAAIALGGRPDAGGSDGGLVTYATRFGVDPAIRSELAADDLEFRRDNDGRILERLFNTNVYFRAYQRQSLDQYGELERLRRAGVRTVSAPPLVVE
ncbi:MAG: DUF3035 domain-containing protein [Litoreibacter sp.]